MARRVKSNIGIIGLGIIGTRAAANLRKAGHQVWVWNRSPRPEPNFLSSAREVAESAKVIEIFVSDGPALLETVQSISSVLGPEHLVINHATVSPAETREAAGIVAERHAKYLDAPFTGSRDAAEAGQLVFYIGGALDAFEQARPFLEVNAKALIPVGEVGEAAVLKIAMNLIVAVSVSSYAEALTLMARNNVPLAKLAEAFKLHGAHSDLGDMKIPAMIQDDFGPRFSLKHMFKDIRIALTLAEEAGVELPAASAFAGTALAAIQRGDADQDFSSIAKVFGFPSKENDLPAELRPASAQAEDQASSPASGEARVWGGIFQRKK